MPDFIVDHTQDWMDFFGAQGHTPKPLASGVEGAVYDLGSDLVAKVWRDRRAADLMKMQGFYGDLASAGLPFATPEILRIEHANGSSVSYERKLPGQPLQDQLGLGDGEIGPATRGCVVDVLQALATVRATAGMYQLAVLDKDQPLRTAGGTFQAALLDLLDRRVARFGPVNASACRTSITATPACGAESRPWHHARTPLSTATCSAGTSWSMTGHGHSPYWTSASSPPPVIRGWMLRSPPAS